MCMPFIIYIACIIINGRNESHLLCVCVSERAHLNDLLYIKRVWATCLHCEAIICSKPHELTAAQTHPLVSIAQRQSCSFLAVCVCVCVCVQTPGKQRSHVRPIFQMLFVCLPSGGRTVAYARNRIIYTHEI